MFHQFGFVLFSILEPWLCGVTQYLADIATKKWLFILEHEEISWNIRIRWMHFNFHCSRDSRGAADTAPPGLPEDVSEWPAGELRKYLEQRSIRHKELDIIGQFGLTKSTWMEAKMAKKWTILDNMILYSSIEVALKYQSVILYRLLVELCEHFFFPRSM